jgi:hypothetical protein
MAPEPTTKPWYEALFKQEPMSDRAYIYWLVCTALWAVVVPLLIYTGTVWWSVLINLVLLLCWATTGVRERQRRMRERAARRQPRSPLAP